VKYEIVELFKYGLEPLKEKIFKNVRANSDVNP
jgi:hypothetical protein